MKNRLIQLGCTAKLLENEPMKNHTTPDQIGWDGSTQQERVLQNAIDRVRLAHESARGEKLYIAFSGGKDSVVLRGVVEEAMLDVMYTLPDRENLQTVIVTEETIMRSGEPIYIYSEEKIQQKAAG